MRCRAGSPGVTRCRRLRDRNSVADPSHPGPATNEQFLQREAPQHPLAPAHLLRSKAGRHYEGEQVAMHPLHGRLQLVCSEGIEATPARDREAWVPTSSIREPPVDVDDWAHERKLGANQPVRLFRRRSRCERMSYLADTPRRSGRTLCLRHGRTAASAQIAAQDRARLGTPPGTPRTSSACPPHGP